MTLITFNRHGFGFYGATLPYSVWIGGITGAFVGYNAIVGLERMTNQGIGYKTPLLWTATISGAVINYGLWSAVGKVK